MQATVEALKAYNGCDWEDGVGILRVRCPRCRKGFRFSRHQGKTVRASARALLLHHTLRNHPELVCPRERSLLLDEAVEGL